MRNRLQLIKLLASISLSALVVITSGCGTQGPETYPTTGVVTLDGQPVEVVLELFSTSGAQPAFARSNSNGEFTLTTFDKADGAMPGEYKVVVSTSSDRAAGKGPESAPLPDQGPSEQTSEDLDISSAEIPEIYTQRSTTPLTVSISPNEENHLEIELESQ